MKVNALSAQKARRSSTPCHLQLVALVPEVHIVMSSIDGFQIFQSRNQNGEQRHVSGTPSRGNARPGDERYTPNGNRLEINESSCGSGSAHLELTQQESEEFTQNSNTNSAVKKKPAEPEPIAHAWGMLRRQGGLQEEFELHHRVVDLKRDTYTIGRSSKSDITVADTWVSTTHCMVYCDYSQPKLRIFIEDCSANGTYINDSLTRLRKNERMELKSGDQIYLLNPRKEENLKKTHASFVFINLRERLVTRREISFAPEHLNQLGGTDQYAITTQQNTTHNTSRVFSTHLSHQYAPHIEDKYIIGDQIGSGMSGQVYFCVNKLTHEQFAVKMIETKKFSLNPGLSVADLREEASLMREFDHPNIIKVVDSFQSDTMIYIVMEWLRGGDLFDRIMERERYTEDTARQLMKQVFSAVEYLHNKNIIHRDLKPENILLVSNKSDVDVKVTDFGLAKKANREGLKTFCGTPQYFAPEVLQRKHHDKSSLQQLSRYGKAVDMWSLGVVLYILLSGSFPFGDDEEILRANYSLSGVEWDGISPGAKHLIRSLMMLNVQDRFTVQEALQHPWINGCNDAPSYQATYKGSVTGVLVGNKKRPPLNPATATNNTNSNAPFGGLNNTTTTNTATATSAAAAPIVAKRAPTAATLKRATSNLHRVNSVFAPLELKHKTSLVYAAAAHSSASTNTAITSITNGSSKSLASGVAAGSSRNSGYPPLPPASEVFTVFGKVTSPTPAVSSIASNDSTMAIAEMKPPKQRNARKGKASTTDDLPIGISNVAGGGLGTASTAVVTRTCPVTKNTVECDGATAGIVPISDSPTDYIDLSHTQYTSTIQLTTRNSSIVHLTVCNTVSCMDAFLPTVGYLTASSKEHANIGTTSGNTQSVTKSHIPIAPNATVNKTSPPEFKRSTSFADSTIITSPSIRLNTATNDTTFTNTPTTTIDTPTNYVLNSKSPGFTITPKTDLNIDPYDDVIEDYSSSDESPNSSTKSSEKQTVKRQKRGNNTSNGTVVLTKPPLSGGKGRAKKTTNKEPINLPDPAITNMEGCATPVNNNNVSEVKTDSGEKRRKRSVSFSDLPQLLNNDTHVVNDIYLDKVGGTPDHPVETVVKPAKETTADVKVAATSSAVIDNPLPASRGIKRMQSSLEQAWKIKPATTAASKMESVISINAAGTAQVNDNSSSTSKTERSSPNENVIRSCEEDAEGAKTTKEKSVETAATESESMPPPAKKLRVPMKSLTELFRMSTSNSKQ